MARKRFQNQTAWITGASSGIGRALAIALSKEGATLLLSGRNQQALAETADACGGAETLAFETTDFDALPGIVEQALARLGHIDMLANNAGISQRSLALDTGFDVYRRLMEVDFFAPLRLTQLVLPHMVARRRGLLINNASIAGKFGSPLRTGYCAAKHALVGWSDALRAEIAQYGIAVHVVTAGYVQTGIAENAVTGDGSPVGPGDDPVNQGLPAADAAEMILAGVARGQREIVVGKPGATELAMLALKSANPDQLFDLMVGIAPKVPRS
ncbi:MAG: SDR family NAD(P)-dependent oxidoreductase [Polymorphobacter sp.]|uniref:SDR family NAD(P)-dependent oxidoreductase n=1 Tax=Polymorphobacter sp. TaxID=1909290 RepID=UPI003A8B8406